MMDVTDIVSTVIMLVVAIICAYLGKISKESANSEKVKAWVDIAVNAAEQAYKLGLTQDRKLYATSILQDLGMKLDWNQVDLMIEAAVNKIPSAVDSTNYDDTVVTGFTDNDK